MDGWWCCDSGRDLRRLQYVAERDLRNYLDNPREHQETLFLQAKGAPMSGSRQLAGVGQPDEKLCPYWVQLRSEIRNRAAKARLTAGGRVSYTRWAIKMSKQYQAHAAKCDHPQHAAMGTSWPVSPGSR